jgi:hypothetical protein
MRHYLLAGTSALALLVGAADADATIFEFSGSVVSFVIPVTGVYDIAAAGARGGGSFNASGGFGAIAGGDVFLTAGTTLEIAVGGFGRSGIRSVLPDIGGGGGGGSFVYTAAAPSTPLVVAGGGGGAFFYEQNGGPGQAGTAGQTGGGGAPYGGAGGTGGTGGGGGNNVLGRGSGGGGAGWLGNGNPGIGLQSGAGGMGPTSFTGGAGYMGYGNGGFGGGGGGGRYGGAGGGGFSGGGGGGNNGGGGGSYVASLFTNVNLVTGGANNTAHGSNGYVTIDPAAAAVPEPASLGLVAAGLIGLRLMRRRRR